MIKAMGMNTLSVYIMWNYHEVSPGVFDFSTENRNFSYFMDLAMKYKMYVVIRPGPYVCAEWDLGGLPAWYLENNTQSRTLRVNTVEFLTPVRRYFQALAPYFKKYDAEKGGPIILNQIENQYGSYGSDLNYISALRQIWKDLNVTIPQYHADGLSVMRNSHWSGAVIGLNGAVADADYKKAAEIDSTSPFIFGSEIYPGWLTHWGQNWASRSVDSTVTEFKTLMDFNHSYSMYMIHGGSNFAFTAGANMQGGASDYTPHITSYDYDAPINEQGGLTLKYNALRALILKYVEWDVPEPPAGIPLISIPAITPYIYATLMDNLPSPIRITNLTHFESSQLKMYSQGIVVYEANITSGNHEFQVVVHDWAIVYIDGVVKETFDRQKSVNHTLAFNTSRQITLRILVEAMGHINYAGGMNTDYKGLITFRRTAGTGDIPSWNVYKLPLDYSYVSTISKGTSGSYPAFGKATFTVAQQGDTFINMKNFVKGYVWVNGRNLGRFWNKGPQFKLFCPGVWLKASNEIIVLELGESSMKSLTGDTTLKLDQ